MICIVNTGIGNFKSIQNMLSRASYSSIITLNPKEISKASKLILPGVGAFDKGIEYLRQYGLDSIIKDMAQSSDIRILGICLGMQLLGNNSEEGKSDGLGIIPGTCRRFRQTGLCMLKVPQMGWNYVVPNRDMALLDQETVIPHENVQRFYFTHSYWFDCVYEDNVVATTLYGHDYPSVIWNGKNVYGVQFHPEKSHRFGLKLLERFAAC